MQSFVISLRRFIGKRCHFIRQMICGKALHLLLPVLIAFCPADGKGEDFKAASDIWSPFFMVSRNQLSGIGVEILIELIRRTGDTVTILYIPTKRALKMFDSHEIDMMVIDSPLWSDPSKVCDSVFTDEVMSIQEYVYFLRDRYIDVKHPGDLNGKIVNIMRGYYYPVFETAFQEGVVEKIEVTCESALVKKLVLKRTDAIFMDSVSFQYMIGELGYPAGMFKKSMELSDTTLGIKLRQEKAHVLPRFNRAIDAMKKDGTMERIIRKYTKQQSESSVPR